MATSVRSRSRQNFPCIDGLRAFAAVSVLLIHTSFVSGFTVHSGLGIYTSRLEIGVSVFFLISGFVLYRPFAAAHFAAAPAPALRGFFVRRLLRIIPAYWLALTVTTYVLHANQTGLHAFAYALTHYGFVQIYFPSQVLKGITQAWSLDTEITFYFFLPVYAALVARGRPSASVVLRRELAGVAAMTAVSYAFREWAFSQHFTLAHTMGDWLPANTDLFALGMLLAVGSTWYAQKGAQPSIARSRAFPLACWLCAAAAFWAVSHLGIPVVPLYQISPGLNLARQTLYGVFAFFLILPAVFGPQQVGLIRGFLRLKPVAAVGIVSYGVYLWHQGWVTMYLRWTHVRLFDNPWPPLLGAAFGLAALSAGVSYFGLEKPALRLRDRLDGQSRVKVGGAPPPTTPPTAPPTAVLEAGAPGDPAVSLA